MSGINTTTALCSLIHRAPTAWAVYAPTRVAAPSGRVPRGPPTPPT